MGRRPVKRCRRPSNGGQAMVEFALTAPFFLLLLSGSIDVSHYTYTRTTLMSNAVDAARRLALPASQSSDCAGLAAAISQGGGISLSGDPKAVVATATFNPTLVASGPITPGRGLVYIFPAVTASGTPAVPGNCGGATRAFPAAPHLVEVQITDRFQAWTPLVSTMMPLTIIAYASAPAAY